MRIDLKNGGWVEGEVRLTESMCGCPTCTCPPFWDISIAIYNSDGSTRMTSCRGSQKDTEEESVKILIEDMERWRDRFNSMGP